MVLHREAAKRIATIERAWVFSRRRRAINRPWASALYIMHRTGGTFPTKVFVFHEMSDGSKLAVAYGIPTSTYTDFNLRATNASMDRRLNANDDQDRAQITLGQDVSRCRLGSYLERAERFNGNRRAGREYLVEVEQKRRRVKRFIDASRGREALTRLTRWKQYVTFKRKVRTVA